eukprot:g26.t1
MFNDRDSDQVSERNFTASVVHRGFMLCNGIALALCILLLITSLSLFVDAAFHGSGHGNAASEKYWLSSTFATFTGWLLFILCLNFAGYNLKSTVCFLVSGFLLCGGFLGELIFILLIVTETVHPKEWKDPSGIYKRIEDSLSSHDAWFVCLIAIVGSYQLLFIIFTFCEARNPVNQDNEWETDFHFESKNRHPFLTENNIGTPSEDTLSTPQRPNGYHPDNHSRSRHEWCIHMKEQYGIDMNQFTYDPRNPNGGNERAQCASSEIALNRRWNLEPNDKQKCSIM